MYFQALNSLCKDKPLFDFDTEKRINICIYQINNLSKYPFLQYILYKKDDNKLYFPYTNSFSSQFTYEQVAIYILNCYNNNIIRNIDDSDISDDENGELDTTVLIKLQLYNNDNIAEYYAGYLEYNNEYYIFYDISRNLIETHYLLQNGDLYLTLIDEIVNSNMVYNLQISKNVSDFFIFNTEFIYLRNNNDEIIDTPTIGYVKIPANKYNYVLNFGIPNTLFDNSYICKDKDENIKDYFESINAFYFENIDLKQQLTGYARFVIFLEKSEFIILSTNKINANDNKKAILDIFNNEEIDSINIAIDIENFILLIKNYNQQYPLTLHR